MKRLLSLLLVLALVLGALGGVPRADAAMSGVIAVASPNTVSSYASYTIQLQGANAIPASGWIQVNFGPSFVMVQGPLTSTLVTINGSVMPSSPMISGTIVSILLSSSIPAGTISVVIQSSPAIKNPTVAGNYPISVTTSVDAQTSSTISVGTSGITGLTAFVTPATTGAIASWSLSFATSATRALAIGETITATFPAGTTLPASMPMGSINISANPYGSVSMVTATGSGSVLTMYVPAAMSSGIGASTFVSIQILTTYGLLNTPVAGNYSILLSTSADTVPASSNQVSITGTTIGTVTVAVSPLTPSTAATYTLFLSTSASGGLVSGDSISVQFPAGTGYPAFINPTLILVNGQPSLNATQTLNTLQISLPPAMSIPASAFVQLQIQTTFGITNPATPGTYKVSSFTSKDSTPVQSNDYVITGTSINSLAVVANPTAQSAYPELRFTFTTSSSGALTTSDYIYIQFPTAMTVPSSVPAASVTVNGVQTSSASSISSGKLSIRTPIAVGNGQQITVVIAETSGIRSPSTVGTTLSFDVSTSEDVGIRTVSYTTTTSQVSQPQVTLTTSGVNKPSGYTVTFQTGAGGLLSAGTGHIYIVFPSGTSVPETIAAQNVRVNGAAASSVVTSPGNRRVEITTPVAVPANSQVTVVIDVAANIVHPSTAATTYTLAVYTSAEQTLVYSAPYSIVNLPASTAVTTPVAPDGLNGYYKTRPTVSITASSPSGYPVSIYYHINTGADTLYGGPVQIPDGTVTFTYYAKDSQNNQEQAKQLTFKVDATAPVVTILSPLEGTVTSTGALSITGRTEAGASVTINGTSVTVQATGDFGGSVTLTEGANAIQVVATDAAGNVGQARVNVTLDTKPPVLTITSPKIYSTVMAQKVAVSGKTEPGATVTVAGAQVNVAADGSFSIMYMFPKEGLNVIDVTATDAAGNVAKTGTPVTYVARTLIRLQVGNKTAMINDTTKTLQAAPINVKGTVMVPIRFIGEAFGATVEWEPVLKIVRLQLGSTIIYLQMGYNYASVNGKKIVLQGLPSIISGTTMVPIRFISEAFNAQVTWIAATQGVEITYPKP